MNDKREHIAVRKKRDVHQGLEGDDFSLEECDRVLVINVSTFSPVVSRHVELLEFGYSFWRWQKGRRTGNRWGVVTLKLWPEQCWPLFPFLLGILWNRFSFVTYKELITIKQVQNVNYQSEYWTKEHLLWSNDNVRLRGLVGQPDIVSFHSSELQYGRW